MSRNGSGGSGLAVAAGLAVALGGGALVVGLLVALFAVSGGNDRTATVTAAAATVTQSATVTATATATETVTAEATAPASTADASALPPDVVAGAHDYVSFACGACHGWQGEGGVNAAVPPLKGAGQEFTSTQLRGIVDHGAGLSDNPTSPFMPVWGPIVSDQQVDHLIAYIKAGLPAVPGIAPDEVPAGATPATAGAILYESLGCINCHGPNGLGGVPNPASPDKSIPPLAGADFRSEFDTPAKIREMIESGSVLGGKAIVSMPHWGGILQPEQIDDLIAYLGTLK